MNDDKAQRHAKMCEGKSEVIGVAKAVEAFLATRKGISDV